MTQLKKRSGRPPLSRVLCPLSLLFVVGTLYLADLFSTGYYFALLQNRFSHYLDQETTSRALSDDSLRPLFSNADPRLSLVLINLRYLESGDFSSPPPNSSIKLGNLYLDNLGSQVYSLGQKTASLDKLEASLDLLQESRSLALQDFQALQHKLSELLSLPPEHKEIAALNPDSLLYSGGILEDLPVLGAIPEDIENRKQLRALIETKRTSTSPTLSSLFSGRGRKNLDELRIQSTEAVFQLKRLTEEISSVESELAKIHTQRSLQLLASLNLARGIAIGFAKPVLAPDVGFVYGEFSRILRAQGWNLPPLELRV